MMLLRLMMSSIALWLLLGLLIAAVSPPIPDYLNPDRLTTSEPAEARKFMGRCPGDVKVSEKRENGKMVLTLICRRK